MARHKANIPSYRRHRASGQAIVTLNGVDHYLGPWNTAASRAEYDRITSEWLVRGRRLSTERCGDPLVKELVLGFYGYCVSTMRDVEVDKVKAALRPVREMYGETKVSAFNPVAFKAVRKKLIASGLAISTIRDRMGIIRRMIAWGVEHTGNGSGGCTPTHRGCRRTSSWTGRSEALAEDPARSARAHSGHPAPSQPDGTGDGRNPGSDRHAAWEGLDHDDWPDRSDSGRIWELAIFAHQAQDRGLGSRSDDPARSQGPRGFDPLAQSQSGRDPVQPHRGIGSAL